jgi:hypothetical protein
MDATVTAPTNNHLDQEQRSNAKPQRSIAISESDGAIMANNTVAGFGVTMRIECRVSSVEVDASGSGSREASTVKWSGHNIN